MRWKKKISQQYIVVNVAYHSMNMNMMIILKKKVEEYISVNVPTVRRQYTRIMKW